MDLDLIRRHEPKLIGEEKIARCAVFIPLIERDGKYDILFQVRSDTLEDQPGDICFPGGRIEEGESPKEAAAREICEELLISENDFEIIGEADTFHTESVIVYTFVGLLKNYSGSFNEEVQSVFTVPAEFFEENDPEVYKMQFDLHLEDEFPYDRIRGGRDYKWRGRYSYQLFYQYEDHTIWGLTAKLVNAFAGLFKKNTEE